jgi:phosphatidylserine/phosphatidylglycerophosphate/cardiolipin synthase-like enzyme
VNPYVSLHAKCVVTDERCTLVTSANFTSRGQHRNIEAGVLIEDAPFAKRFLAHWRALVSQGFAERYKA